MFTVNVDLKAHDGRYHARARLALALKCAGIRPTAVAPEEPKHMARVLFESFNRHLWLVWDQVIVLTETDRMCLSLRVKALGGDGD